MVPQPEYMTSTVLHEIVPSHGQKTGPSHYHAEPTPLAVMLNKVKHLYNKDSSLALRMTNRFSD